VRQSVGLRRSLDRNREGAGRLVHDDFPNVTPEQVGMIVLLHDGERFAAVDQKQTQDGDGRSGIQLVLVREWFRQLSVLSKQPASSARQVALERAALSNELHESTISAT